MTRLFTDETADVDDESDIVDESDVLDDDASEYDDDADGLDSETLGDDDEPEDESDQDDGSDNDDDDNAPESVATEATTKLTPTQKLDAARAAWSDAVGQLSNGDEPDAMAVAAVFGQCSKPSDALNSIGGATAFELLTAGQPDLAMSVAVFRNAVETVLTTVVVKAAAGPSPEKLREALVRYVAETQYVRDAIAYALETAPELPDLGDLTDEEQAVLDNAGSEDLVKRLDRIGTLINREYKPPTGRKNASASGSTAVPNKSAQADFVPGAEFEHKDQKGDVVHRLVVNPDGSATATRVASGETRTFPADDKFIAKHSAEWVVGKGTNLNGYKHWGPA